MSPSTARCAFPAKEPSLLSRWHTSQRCTALYMQALAAMRTERYADAITLLDSLLALEPSYRDAADRRDAARRSQRSATCYERGRAAEAAGNWASAVAEYTAIIDSEPDYRDASKRLADCTRRQQVASLQEELHMHVHASEWQAVVAVGGELTALGVKSAEVDRAVKTARQRIRREKEESRVQQPERPERRGCTAGFAAVTGDRLRRKQPVEGTGTRRPHDEFRFADGGWRISMLRTSRCLGRSSSPCPCSSWPWRDC